MVTSIDEFIGRQLRAKREAWGMSIEQLAAAVDTTPITLEAYERGQLRIGASLLMGLCSVFNVKPGYFFEGCEKSVSRKPSDARSDGNIVDFRPRRNR